MIREAIKSDLEDLCNLMLEGHNLHLENREDIFKGGSNEIKDYVKSILENNLAYKFVYVKDSKIVGLIFTSIKHNLGDNLTKERKVAFIEYIIVSENYKRQKIGTKLYKYLSKILKNQNINAIELCVWGFNKDAIKFYESLGMNIKNMRFEEIIK